MFKRVNENVAKAKPPLIVEVIPQAASRLLWIVCFLVVTLSSLSAQGVGIGTYDLRSTSDLSFAFDYNGTGNSDHLVMYRPGTGIIYILAQNNGAFTPVFHSTSGIGTYDLTSTADRIFPFDYSGTGYKDHLVCYRPGTGIIYVLANNQGTFTPVYHSTNGIGDYDLKSTADTVFPFDFDSSGFADHLVLYRPGSGMVHILANVNGVFHSVFSSDGKGIGSYDLSSTADRMFAFDYNGIGTADHLVLYRPGSGIIYILANDNGTFQADFMSVSGIGTYDLTSTNDRLLAFDYNGSGLLDHLIAYRPGTGIIYILQSAYFAYTPVFQSITGIGSYDLKSTADRITTLDYSGTGLMDHLVIYRPGDGIIYIEQNANGVFSPALASGYVTH